MTDTKGNPETWPETVAALASVIADTETGFRPPRRLQQVHQWQAAAMLELLASRGWRLRQELAVAPSGLELHGLLGIAESIEHVEQALGFTRPMLKSYRHVGRNPGFLACIGGGHVVSRLGEGGCGAVSTMVPEIAENFARAPQTYGGAFCICCRAHFPLGHFAWDGTNVILGSVGLPVAVIVEPVEIRAPPARPGVSLTLKGHGDLSSPVLSDFSSAQQGDGSWHGSFKIDNYQRIAAQEVSWLKRLFLDCDSTLMVNTDSGGTYYYEDTRVVEVKMVDHEWVVLFVATARRKAFPMTSTSDRK